MHAVIRTYSGHGAKELFNMLEQDKSEEGGFSVSVFQDKAGSDESVRVARDYISKNAGNVGVAPPKVSEGSVILQAKWIENLASLRVQRNEAFRATKRQNLAAL